MCNFNFFLLTHFWLSTVKLSHCLLIYICHCFRQWADEERAISRSFSMLHRSYQFRHKQCCLLLQQVKEHYKHVFQLREAFDKIVFNWPSILWQTNYLYTSHLNVTICFYRAAAHSKLNNHSAALEDCNSALKIDPNYSKAYGRKGSVWFLVRKLIYSQS